MMCSQAIGNRSGDCQSDSRTIALGRNLSEEISLFFISPMLEHILLLKWPALFPDVRQIREGTDS
jgi:hypothetical protein